MRAAFLARPPLVTHRAHGHSENVTLTLRLDTRAEIEYVKRGGILPYALEGLAA